MGDFYRDQLFDGKSPVMANILQRAKYQIPANTKVKPPHADAENNLNDVFRQKETITPSGVKVMEFFNQKGELTSLALNIDVTGPNGVPDGIPDYVRILFGGTHGQSGVDRINTTIIQAGKTGPAKVYTRIIGNDEKLEYLLKD